MSRVFAYCRVSTTDQSTENQVFEIASAGFALNERRTVKETISGSVPAEQRPGFQRLMDKLESEDVLVVTKLDRIARSMVQGSQLVNNLLERGVTINILNIGKMDNTPSSKNGGPRISGPL